jgi:hypothetical protein
VRVTDTMAATLTHRSLILSRTGAPGAGNAGIVQSIAAGDLRLFTPSNALVSASNEIVMSVAGSNIITLWPTRIDIAGDVNVLGNINNVLTNELHVTDKVVRVAYAGCNLEPPPELLLDGSGLYVSDPSDAAEAPGQERSVLWRAGVQGARAMLQPGGMSNESFWEFRGGGLRLTSGCRAGGGGGEVSYGLRINEAEELEVYKRWTDAAGGATMRYARVAAFGPALDKAATNATPFELV